MMVVLNFTAELEVERGNNTYDYDKNWCVIKLNDYEIGRIEMSGHQVHEEKEALETAAAVWLAERLKS